MSDSRPSRAAVIVIGGLVVGAVALVALSLQRPNPPTFPPSPIEPSEVGAALVGPLTYTVDASDPERWHFFDFSTGSLVEAPGPAGWDVAFRRFNVFVNGGEGFAGQGGVLDLGEVAFDSVTHVPTDGYVGTDARRDSVSEPLKHWYDYGFTTHVLSPMPHVYAIRTADGRYVKLEILSYYCPGAEPGCLTFRYVYQGAGGTEVAGRPPAPSTPAADSATPGVP